jgi:phage FluMu protein Com
VDAEKELRELKKRLYIENGVYLYKCERCEQLVALHQESCRNCKTINSFYERPERPISDVFMTELDQIY